MNSRFMTGAVLFAFLALGAAAHAHSTATGIVKERMDAMKAIGKATKSIVEMMQGKQDYDPVAVAASAAVIEEHGGDSLLHQFPEGSLDDPTEALPVIWEDWVEFKTLVEDLRREAVLLKTVAENGPAGFGETIPFVEDRSQPAGPVATRLLKTCKDCHDTFREEN